MRLLQIYKTLIETNYKFLKIHSKVDILKCCLILNFTIQELFKSYTLE